MDLELFFRQNAAFVAVEGQVRKTASKPVHSRPVSSSTRPPHSKRPSIIDDDDMTIKPNWTPPTYSMLTEHHARELAENGFTIVEGVVPLDMCEKMRVGVFERIHEINPAFDIHSGKTPRQLNSAMLQNRHGILQHFNIGFIQALWDVKTDPRVIQIFRAMWDMKATEWPWVDMLLSFDGLSAGIPLKKGSKPEGRPHVDQSPQREAKQNNKTTPWGASCVQGFVHFSSRGDFTGLKMDTQPEDGGLRVLKGSHLKLKATYEALGIHKTPKDWHDFTPKQIQQYYGDCPVIKVCPKPGDLVLWDSRTVHWADRPMAEADVVRMVCYVCATPRKLATLSQLIKKWTAFKQLRMTTHWPHDPYLFPLMPQTYGNVRVEAMIHHANRTAVIPKIPHYELCGASLGTVLPPEREYRVVKPKTAKKSNKNKGDAVAE